MVKAFGYFLAMSLLLFLSLKAKQKEEMLWEGWTVLWLKVMWWKEPGFLASYDKDSTRKVSKSYLSETICLAGKEQKQSCGFQRFSAVNVVTHSGHTQAHMPLLLDMPVTTQQ